MPLDCLADGAVQAEAAGLTYVNDSDPGISRTVSGKGFVYRRPSGAKVADAATLDRIQALAIPPAYTDVWICPDPDGHIQATGRDARGRRQYRYHSQWREHQDGNKYGRMAAFGRALPRLRAAVDADLARRGMPREKALAARILAEGERPAGDSHARRVMAECVRQVSQRLGNTPAVCRRSYIHPGVLSAYAQDRLAAVFRGTGSPDKLEAALLRFLKQC